MRIALATLVAVGGLQVAASATLDNPFSPKRVAVVTTHTARGAQCSLADSVTGTRLRSTVGPSGKTTWRWHPSMWAEGIDNVTVHCTKGSARRSAKTFFLLQRLSQFSVLRDYAVHLVYWAPKGDLAAAVPQAVVRLETDIQASLNAGATDNPFAIPRAYGDSLGGGDPRIASIDAINDTDPYTPPAKGYCQRVSTPCMGNPNLATEVERLARQRRWTGGNHTLVIVLTGTAVTVCTRFVTPNCTPGKGAFGFHDVTPAGYAYADIIMSGDDSSITPVDYAVALIGHEQNEAVVDPLANGVEIGDPCEGQFKIVPINAHPYRLPALELPSTKCAFAYTP